MKPSFRRSRKTASKPLAAPVTTMIGLRALQDGEYVRKITSAPLNRIAEHQHDCDRRRGWRCRVRANQCEAAMPDPDDVWCLDFSHAKSLG